MNSTADLQSRSKNQEIDETGQSSNAQVLNSNDPGRCGRSSRRVLNRSHKAWVRWGADDTHGKDTNNVKSNKAIEDELRQTGDGVPRVLNLSSRDCQHVRACDRESCIDDDRPEHNVSTCAWHIQSTVVRLTTTPEICLCLLRHSMGSCNYRHPSS